MRVTGLRDILNGPTGARSRPPAPRIPLALITGFLGSGKTTLLNRALRDPGMRGAMVVINEFGDVGLDHVLVANSSDNIVVLEHGCLCCTVFGDLVGTLNKLYHRRAAGEIPEFDRVLIETSGVADPTSIVQAFLSDPTLEGLYVLTGVVTVIDAVNCRTTLERHDEAARQIALADHIVITKLDMASESDRPVLEDEVRSTLKTMNRAAIVFVADGPDLDLSRLLRWSGYDPSRGTSEAKLWLAEDGAAASAESGRENSTQHGGPHRRAHLEIGSLSFVRSEPLPRLALQLLLEALERNLGASLLRLKAIVTVEGAEQGPAVIQGAQHLLHNVAWLDHWPFADRKSRFVLIAAGIGTDALREMVALLDRIASRSAARRPA